MTSSRIRRGTATLGVAAVIAGALAPLHAQDADSVYGALFQSLRSQERAAPEPRLAPRAPRDDYYAPALMERRFPQRPPRTVRERKRAPEAKPVEAAKTKPAPAPKAAQIPSNPHLALLTDPTLRPGDVAMFPDGPRIFQGEPGDRHVASDFVPVSKAKGLSKSDRRYLTALRSGVNDAWVDASDGTKLARNGGDVETTGSIGRKRSRR